MGKELNINWEVTDEISKNESFLHQPCETAIALFNVFSVMGCDWITEIVNKNPTKP